MQGRLNNMNIAPRRTGLRIASFLLAALLALSGGQMARACAFHGYTPDPTLVDVLLTTEQAIVARVNPAAPDRYQPLEVLAGAQVAQVPLRVSAELRAQLSGRPEATVLLARDGIYGPWLALAVLDRDYRRIIEHVLNNQVDWLYGDGQARLAYFARRLNHANPDIRRLALREMDCVPYGALRALRRPKIHRLGAELETGDAELRPIRILLAGLSRDRRYSPYLEAKLAQAVREDVPYLGAYATALIELEGRAAVDPILESYLKDESLPLKTRVKLLDGLAVQHKTAPRATRRAIVLAVADLLKSSPEFFEAAPGMFGYDGR